MTGYEVSDNMCGQWVARFKLTDCEEWWHTEDGSTCINTFEITWNYKDQNGVDTWDTKRVEYGQMPSHLDPVPYQTTTTGYTFSGWNPALTWAIQNTTYTAVYSEVSRVYPVLVKYYEMDLSGNYSDQPYATDNLTGIIWTTKTVTPDSRVGFALDTDRSNTSVEVTSGENLISIYYKRNQHQLGTQYSWDFYYNYNLVHFEPTLKQYYYYGEHISIEVSADTWYTVNDLTLSGWNNAQIQENTINFDMWDADATLTVGGTKNHYTIDYFLAGWNPDPNQPDNLTGYSVTETEIHVYNPIRTGFIFLWWTGWVVDWTQLENPTTWLVIRWEDTGLWNRAYYANWTEMDYEVELSANPEEWWTTSWAGIYKYNQEVSILATANEWYHFTGWYAWEHKVWDNPSYTFTADETGWTGLTARFELNEYDINLGTNDASKWTVEINGGDPKHGKRIEFRAYPSLWYILQRWILNGNVVKTWDNQEYTWEILVIESLTWNVNLTG